MEIVPVDVNNPAQIAAQVAAIERHIAQAETITSPSDAAGSHQRIKVLREAAAKLNVATQARVAYQRLEATLLRQIGRLGGEKEVLSSTLYQSAARRMASLEAEQWQEFLNELDGVGAITTIFDGWYVSPEDARYRAEWAARAAEHAERYATDSEYRQKVQEERAQQESEHEAWTRSSRVAEAVATLVQDYDGGSAPFTVSNVVDSAVELFLGTHSEFHETSEHDHETLRGYTTAVTEDYLRASTGNDEGLPSRITYIDSEGYWVRVPWQVAQLHHLEFMARYRRKQAQEVAAKADYLEALVDAYTAGLKPGEDARAQLASLGRRKAVKDALNHVEEVAA